MDKIVLVYTTWPSQQSAEEAAKVLVREKLAACANVFPGGKSIFFWKGKMETAAETTVIFKTTPEFQERLREKITSIHSYDCPCILNVDVSGHQPFLNWVRSTLAE